MSLRGMDTANYVKGFTSAITGVAAGAAIKSALNAANGSIAGNTPVKQGALDAMSNYAGDAQQRTASLANTMPASPTAAANQAVGGTSKNDQLQQAMMQAMMQKMMQDQAKGAEAKNKDGSHDTNKLDPRVQQELAALTKGMKDYIGKLNETYQQLKKEKQLPDNNPIEKDVKALTEAQKEHMDLDTEKGKKNFNPQKVIDASDKLAKTLDEALEKDPSLKDSKNFQKLVEQNKQIKEQAVVAKSILEKNPNTLLKITDQAAKDAEGNLSKITEGIGDTGTLEDDSKLKPFSEKVNDLSQQMKDYTSGDTEKKSGINVDTIRTSFEELQKSFTEIDKDDKEKYQSLMDAVGNNINNYTDAKSIIENPGAITEDKVKDFTQDYLKDLDYYHHDDKGEIIKDLGIDPTTAKPLTPESSTPTPNPETGSPQAQAEKLDLNFDDLLEDLQNA